MGGPARNFKVEAPTLGTEWPEDGPRALWKRPLGEGYSGIAVGGDRLFTLYRDGDDEVIVAARLDNGETLWERRHAAPFASYHRMEHGVGPHVTPTLVEGRVIAAGIFGDLTAYDAESGEQLWRTELIREMGGTEMDRGYSNNPLLLGTLLIVPVGGKGQGIAAIDSRTGTVVWANQDFENGYSSPLLIDLDGQSQLVFLNTSEIVGLSPEDGTRLWSHPHATQYGLNISVPIWSPDDHLLFLSSAYNGGSRVLRLEQSNGKTSVEELWAHQQMRIHIGNAIRIGGVVWGSNGDFGPVPFTGVDIETGEIVYRTREIARAFHLLADGKLIALDEDGVLTLATPTPDGLDIHAQADVFDSRAWTPPTLVGRTLLARDQESLVALELP